MIGNDLMSLGAAVTDFRRARRRAGLEVIMARMSGDSVDLLSYEDVRRKLKARESGTKKLQDVPLDAIVGSVGRYTDFTRNFLPRTDSTEHRWASIKVATTSPTGGLPPIELYKVGDAYFVVDGHHRVSVARELGSSHIEAYVTEVETKVPLSPDDSPDDLIIKAEYTDFLRETELDTLRPEADLTLTAPGKYRLLKEHIDVHRYFMGIEQNREIPYREAVTHWYDTVYLPTVQLIRERDLLRDFPERTEADLYLWIMEHRSALQEALGWELATDEVATDLVEQYSMQPKHVVARVGRKILDVVTPVELDAGPAPGTWRSERMSHQHDDRLFGDVLVAINGEDSGWSAFNQALAIAQHEGTRLKGLHVVSSEAQLTSEGVKSIQEEFERRLREADVVGRLAVEVGTVTRQICERARWADLVILSLAHPPASRPLARLSSGLRTILRRCPRPVLVVPAGKPPSNLERALLAYDGSLRAQEALFIGTYMACAWHTDLTVLTVDELNNADEIIEEARQYLEERNVAADIRIEKGLAGEVILRVAEERNADFLLLGGFSASPVIEVILGSTVEHLLQTAEHPMLICH